MATPPIPVQRKVKLGAALKNTLSEQATKLQAKHQKENDLLEDIRSYTKLRAAAEKEYGQALLKITSQLSAKYQTKEEDKEEDKRLPYGLWRLILQETESLANSCMKISQTLHTSVAEPIKNLKNERIATFKKCSSLSDKIHEELHEAAGELVKAQKIYSDVEKVTLQAKEHEAEAEERLQKGTIGLFSSKARLERTHTKAKERLEVSEKRSNIVRNEYLLTLAANNAHQQKYYSKDLPELIDMQDGTIYNDFRNFYTIIISADIESYQKNLVKMQTLEEEVSHLGREFAFQDFHEKNKLFTEYENHKFIPVPGDTVNTITMDSENGLHLNKDARKWTLRFVKEEKIIKKKQKELNHLNSLSLASGNSAETSESLKTREQSIDTLTEEIRHLEVVKTQIEGRIEALRGAGVDVDEWLRGAIPEVGEENEEDIDDTFDYEFAEDEFAEDNWTEEPQLTTTYSHDSISTASSMDHLRTAPSTTAIVVYAFSATSQEEISIEEGEELEIVESEGDGWCKTRNKAGLVGYVPEAYIEIVNASSQPPSQQQSVATETTEPVQHIQHYEEINAPNVQVEEVVETPFNGEQSVLENDEAFICYARAIYDYDACEDEELSFKEDDVIKITSKMVDDDDGWWMGVLNGCSGVFPNIVVEEIS